MADAPRRGALLARLAEQEPELLQAAGKSISARHVGVLVDRRAGGNWWLNWAGVDVVDPRREQAEAGFAASIAQCTPPPMRLTKLRLDCLHLHKSNAPIAQFGLVAQTVRRARRPPIRRPATPDSPTDPFSVCGLCHSLFARCHREKSGSLSSTAIEEFPIAPSTIGTTASTPRHSLYVSHPSPPRISIARYRTRRLTPTPKPFLPAQI